MTAELHLMEASDPLPTPARVYTADEIARLRAGLDARSMDEKWIFRMHGDTLHLHRSWTGHEIFRAHFAAHGTGWKIDRLDVVARPSCWYSRTSRPETDTYFVELLIAALGLDEDSDAAWKHWSELSLADELERELSDSWHVFRPDDDRREAFDRELDAELPPDHPLTGRNHRAAAVAGYADDTLFSVGYPGEAWALVHLTWTGRTERAEHPDTRLFEDWPTMIAALAERDEENR